MKSLFRIAALCTLLAAGAAATATAAERVALVIGNNTYDQTKPANSPPNLLNAVGDAEAVQGLLTGKLGFKAEDVVLARNLNGLETREKLEQFRAKAAAAQLAVIYYAGHGMESLDRTTNFMIPVDADPVKTAASDAHLRSVGINIDEELRLLARAAPRTAKVLLMDCCRDRPAERNLGVRSGGGLVLMADDAIPAGTLVMLAASPGGQASDGKKRGPFAQALVEVLPLPDQTLFESFFKLSDKVEDLTQGRQIPWLKTDGSARAFREMVLVRGNAGPPEPRRDEGVMPGSKAGERKLVEVAPGLSIPFRWCPAGTFTMGSPQEEFELAKKWGANPWIETAHTVTLSAGFWLAETEITQAQWSAVMGSTMAGQGEKALADMTEYSEFNRKTCSDHYGVRPGDDIRDLVGTAEDGEAMAWVNRVDSGEWCASANRHAGIRGWSFTLPTEAQWEYACRAGTSGMSYAGNFEIKGRRNAPGLDGIAWYGGNSSEGFEQDWGTNTSSWEEKQYPGGRAGARLVATRKANPWGLHDMLGNVEEWCEDRPAAYESGSVTDPRGPAAGAIFSTRGGWWMSPAAECRVAYRAGASPSCRDLSRGFRPALVPDKGTAQIAAPSSTPNLAAVIAVSPGSDLNQGAVGKTFAIKLPGDVEMTFCYCPPGSFTRGSPKTEEKRFSDETQAPVRMTQGFWLARTETTQAQWRAVAGNNPSSFAGADLPVENVSWEDLEDAIGKLNRAGGLPAGWKWALPTEAQWEYACRAGATTAFSFGKSLSSRQANFDGRSPYGGAAKGPDMGKTVPVASYKPNPWGLHDMHGNVWEWCDDWYFEKPPGGADPVASSAAIYRVCRGGAWSSQAGPCRAAHRHCLKAGTRSFEVGVRLALVPSR